MVRGGKHDPLDLGLPRGFEQVVAADDVGVEDRLPRCFQRVAAEMHDALHACHDLLHVAHAGEVGPHELFIGREIGRSLEIAPADLAVDAFEELAQAGADAAGRAGHQHALHVLPFPKLELRSSLAGQVLLG